MKTRKITLTALFVAISFALSLLEAFVPVAAVIPIPGLKLGLANIAVTAALFMCGKTAALSVAVLRPLLSLLLFGNVTGFFMSLCGGLFSFASLMLFFRFYGKVFTFGGISVMCAVFHSIGQITAASFVMTDLWVFSYLPLLCAASSAAGLLNGMIMNAVIGKLDKILNHGGACGEEI